MPASPQTLYLRTTQSTVVSGNSSVHELSQTQGGTSGGATDGGIVHATNTGTWQFIPGNTSNSTTKVTGSTPSSQGWIFDSQSDGTYAAGTWTVDVDYKDTTNTGTAEILASLWVVTATSSAVTSVSQIANAVASSSFTNSATQQQKTVTISGVSAVQLLPNQYVYLELYFDETVASGGGSATVKNFSDDSTAKFSAVVTPIFTVAVHGTLSSTLGAATIASTGTNLDHAQLSATLGAATISATGIADHHNGSLSATLGAATISAAGTNKDHAQVNVTLGSVAISAGGTNKDHGAFAKTLGAATISAAGTNKDHGALSKTLGAVTISATGTVVGGIVGILFKVLSAVSHSATGTVKDHGALSATLGGLTISAQAVHTGAATLVFTDQFNTALPAGVVVNVYEWVSGVQGSLVGTGTTVTGGSISLALPNGPTAEYQAVFTGFGSPSTPQVFGPIALPMYLDESFELDAGFLLDGTTVKCAGFSLIPPSLIPIVVPLLSNNGSSLPSVIFRSNLQIGSTYLLLVISPCGTYLENAANTIIATDPTGVVYSWNPLLAKYGAYTGFLIDATQFNVLGRWSCQLESISSSVAFYSNNFIINVVS